MCDVNNVLIQIGPWRIDCEYKLLRIPMRTISQGALKRTSRTVWNDFSYCQQIVVEPVRWEVLRTLRVFSHPLTTCGQCWTQPSATEPQDIGYPKFKYLYSLIIYYGLGFFQPFGRAVATYFVVSATGQTVLGKMDGNKSTIDAHNNDHWPFVGCSIETILRKKQHSVVAGMAIKLNNHTSLEIDRWKVMSCADVR